MSTRSHFLFVTLSLLLGEQVPIRTGNKLHAANRVASRRVYNLEVEHHAYLAGEDRIAAHNTSHGLDPRENEANRLTAEPSAQERNALLELADKAEELYVNIHRVTAPWHEAFIKFRNALLRQRERDPDPFADVFSVLFGEDESKFVPELMDSTKVITPEYALANLPRRVVENRPWEGKGLHDLRASVERLLDYAPAPGQKTMRSLERDVGRFIERMTTATPQMIDDGVKRLSGLGVVNLDPVALKEELQSMKQTLPRMAAQLEDLKRAGEAWHGIYLAERGK